MILTMIYQVIPSVLKWDTVEKSGKFSLTTMVVDHHSVGPWHVPSLHEKFSVGWNRTFNRLE